MPIRGPLTHVDLSISDPDASVPFYEALFSALGYERLDVPNPDFQGLRPRRAAWQIRFDAGASFGIEVRPSSGPCRWDAGVTKGVALDGRLQTDPAVAC